MSLGKIYKIVVNVEDILVSEKITGQNLAGEIGVESEAHDNEP